MLRLASCGYRSVFAAVAFLICFSTSAFASHYRGGTVSWVPTGTPGEVEFRIKWAERGIVPIGWPYQQFVIFGDGTSALASGTVTSVDSIEGWFIAEMTVRHQYPASATAVTATVESCCRISTLKNGRDGTMRLQTLVRPWSGNSSPVSGLPVIVAVPRTGAASFVVPASDAERDPVRFRLATQGESAVPQPANLAVDAATGRVTWPMPANAVVGDLWTTQIMVEDLDANGQVRSKTPIDFIMKVVQMAGTAPTLTVTPAGPFSVRPGTPVTFTVTGTDPDTNARVSLNTSGVPPGAAMSPAVGALLTPPVTSTFTWTPGAAQGGSFVVTFTATDDTFQQTLRSVTIFVEENQPPAISACAPPVSVEATSAQGGAARLEADVVDTNGDPLSVEWLVGGVSVASQQLAAAAGTRRVTLDRTYAIGTHQVSVRVTDDKGMSVTCATSVQVTKANQSITFDPVTDRPYGSAPVVLSAAASSNLPVALQLVSGPGQLSGSTLTILGTGLVVVRASQAGDATFNPAADVDQAFVITKVALNVRANDAGRVYGAPNPGLSGTITGLVNDDAITATYSSMADASSPVGSYAIVPALNDPTNKLGNYDVVLTNGTLAVTKAALSVAADDATRTYGAANPAFAGTISGIVNGDAITATYSSMADASSPVGSYAIVPALNDPTTRLGNYTVTLTNGSLTVRKAALLITADDATRPYGGANPAFTGSISGLQNGDAISATYSTSATRSSAVDNYEIAPAPVDSTGRLANYELTLVNGTLAVTRVPLVVGVSDSVKVYGSELPGFTASFDGFVLDEGPAALQGAITFSTRATAASPVGTYAVTPGGLTSVNYAITFVDGTLTISPAPLTIAANDASMIVGAALPSFTATYTGLLAGDAPATLGGTLTFTTAAGSTSPVGTYAVVPGGVTSTNYTIAFKPGTLTVTYGVREAYDTTKAHRSGSTIPVKVQLSDANGANTSAPSAVLTAFALSHLSSAATGDVADAGDANPDGNFRFALLDGAPGYVFNLKTTGLSTGIYELHFRVSGDPTPHAVRFQIR